MGGSEKKWAQWLGEKGTAAYIFIMLVFFPVFYINMFRLTTDKMNFFLFFTFLYACVLLPSLEKPALRADMVFVGILLTAVVISTLYAENIPTAFLEISDRSVSGLCLLGCILVYLGVRKYGFCGKLFLAGWLVGSTLIYLLGILCAWGLDVLHIQEGVALAENYLTPLGNTNYNTCYICIMLPPVMALYIIGRKTIYQILLGLNLYLGFLFTIFIKTESSILAVTAGMVILLYFALEKEEWLGKYVWVTGLYAGAKITAAGIRYLFQEQMYIFDGPGQAALGKAWICCDLLYFILVAVLYKKKGKICGSTARARKALLWTAAVSAIGFTACVIGANVGKDAVSKNPVLYGLIFRDRSFSNRGFIWKRTVRLLRREPLGRKLFGNGLNCFYEYFMTARYQKISLQRFGWHYLDPHSECLQMMVDMGVLGVVGYFGLIIQTLIKAAGSWRKNELSIVVVLTLCVYMIQGTVNAYTIYHLPFLFLFLGAANGERHLLIE